jgi:hypothetical protein
MLDMNTRLTSLSLEGSRSYFPSSDPVILCLPNLRRLATSDSITSIGGQFPELQELFLHENFDKTWRHIHNILSNSVKLQFLTLSEWGNSTSFDSDTILRILNPVNMVSNQTGSRANGHFSYGERQSTDTHLMIFEKVRDLMAQWRTIGGVHTCRQYQIMLSHN